MINLIPPQGLRTVHKEYIFRVLTVWAYACVFAFIGAAIALMPTYVLFTKQLQTDVTPLGKDAETIDADYAETQKTLEGATAVAQQLAQEVPTVNPSAVIYHVESAVTSGIIIEGISMAKEAGLTTIEVSGVAATREALRRFVETLKRDVYFADARVPVSDFARDTKLPFTITGTVKP